MSFFSLKQPSSTLKYVAFLFNAQTFYVHTAALLTGQEMVFSRALVKTEWKLQDFPWAEVAQAKSASLPVKKLSLNTMSSFAHNHSDKKVFLAARAKAYAERLVRMLAKQFLFRPAEIIPQTSRSALPLTLGSSRPWERWVSGRPSRRHLSLPPTSLRHEVRRVSVRRVRYGATSRVVDSRGRRTGWKKANRLSSPAPPTRLQN